MYEGFCCLCLELWLIMLRYAKLLTCKISTYSYYLYTYMYVKNKKHICILAKNKKYVPSQLLRIRQWRHGNLCTWSHDVTVTHFWYQRTKESLTSRVRSIKRLEKTHDTQSAEILLNKDESNIHVVDKTENVLSRLIPIHQWRHSNNGYTLMVPVNKTVLIKSSEEHNKTVCYRIWFI